MSVLSLRSYLDLLEKCRYELGQLQNCSLHPEYDFAIVNLVLSMNHIYEWCLLDEDIGAEQKQECVRRFNPYSPNDNLPRDLKKKYPENEFPQVNLYQEALRSLSNKAKHFKKKRVEIQTPNYTALCGEESMQCGELATTCGAFDHYLYFVEIDDRDVGLEQMLSDQLEE